MAMSNKLDKAIDAYLNVHSDAKTARIQPVELAGKRMELAVLRLPIDLLRYNITNGRFAAEYAELRNRLRRDLDPNDKNDALKIRELLLSQEKRATQLLKDDLKRIGQLEPGVITYDGSVINGNRRMAVFEQIADDTGDAQYSYLDVVRLPPGVSEKDLWRLEANLQFSREERLDYGPINRLLKFREGIKAGLSERQIAASMYGGSEKDVKEDLKRLELIETYLEYIGKKGNYKAAERVHEHFIDLRKIIVSETKAGTDPIQLEKITKFVFDLIRQGKSHWELRKIKEIIKTESAKENMLRAIEHNTKVSEKQTIEAGPEVSVNPDESSTPSVKSQGREENRVEPESKSDVSIVPASADNGDVDQGLIATETIFQESLEIAKAVQSRDEPLVLLTKALTNLKEIDVENPVLGDQKARQLIDEILTIVKQLVITD